MSSTGSRIALAGSRPSSTVDRADVDAGPAKTYCRVCEAACGLEVDFDHAGAPVRIRPDREHPVSAVYACAKGTRFLEVARHPDRVLVPQVDGRDASWDDAIATAGIAARVRAAPPAVVHG